MARLSHEHRISRRFHHPAQSAMEYLMTYGWAILIISIVLFALFQLGVFNSSGSAPTAQPGSCRVAKLYSANGGVQASLLGSCSGLKPQFFTQFNGASSDVSLPSTPLSGTGDFTILAWIKTNTAAEQGIVTVGNTACGSGASLSVDSSGYLEEDPSCSTGPTSTPTIVNDGKYYFVGVVYNGPTPGTIQLYVDGAASGGPTSQSLNIQTGSSYIGKDASSHYFNGIITNVQIYNTSLSASEIMTLYQEGIGGAPIPLPGMIGWWPLNGNTDDYSGSGNNGVPTSLSSAGSTSGGTSGGSSSSVATTIATTIATTTISPTCYLLTLTAGSGGTSTTADPANSVGCPTGNFLSGATITLTATPADGYAFTGWTGTSSNSMNPWTFTMPGSDASELAGFINPSTSAWQTTNILNVGSLGLSCVTSSGYIYCLGGANDGALSLTTVQNSLILSSGGTSAWVSQSNALVASEKELSCVTSSGFIYCMGGTPDGSTAVSTVQYAQIIGGGLTTAWQTTNTLSAPEYIHSCVTSSGYIYCMGGYSSGGGSTTVQYAQVLGGAGTSTWQTTNTLAVGEEVHSCVTANDYIYCIGGVHDNRAVQYASILSGGGTSAWSSSDLLSHGEQGFSCITANNYIYCLGGSNIYATAVQYSPLTSGGPAGSFVVQSGNSLVSYVQSESCITANNYIYCMGGAPGGSYKTVQYASLLTG